MLVEGVSFTFLHIFLISNALLISLCNFLDIVISYTSEEALVCNVIL